ncbi:MAG TPA: ABC transporter ATP-binding protein [Candidatus Egerieenecus merdigallinarum]|nr:ABC transporter ATP-binding protein [Candidatus Egerieenecus merdigallinarum]
MSTKEVVKRLMHYVKPYGALLVGALVCAVIYVVMSLLSPVLIGQAVDGIIGPGQVDFAGIGRIALYLVFVLAAGGLFQWLMTLCTNKVCYRTVKDLRTEVFSRIIHVPLKFIDQNAHGNIINRIVNDVDSVSDGLLQGFTQLFTGVITILGTLGFMISINPWIALVVVALTPVSLVIATLIARGTHTTFLKQSRIQGELSGHVEEMLSGQKLVKLFGHEKASEEKLEEINQRLYVWGYKAQIYPAFTNPLTRFVNGLVYAAVGVAGALAAVRGVLTIGQLSCFLSYANQYTKPFNEVTGIMAQLQTAMAAARRLMALIDEPVEEEASPLQHLPQGNTPIAFEDVSFHYLPDRPLIEHFHLEVQPGQRIAIVGPTGCGKTTLINLLMRFYDVVDGAITLGGVDIRTVSRDELRSRFGMVLQETWLTQATVAENIGYGKPGATREEIIAAAKAAHADSFIRRLPQGYDTVISENGGNLSQGQKQLLCIARVMLMDPPMLILDEATSNIDTMTELRVQKAFAAMVKGRTSFVVAHRLSTIKEADRILVMNQGHVVETGTHETLLAQNGFYAKLYRSQFEAQEHAIA